MPKKNNKKVKRGGGWLESLSTSLSSNLNNLSSNLGSSFENLKKNTKISNPFQSPTTPTTMSSTSSMTPTTMSSTSSMTPTTMSSTSSIPNKYGGKRSRKMYGGYKDNIALTGLAANAAPFSGITAKPNTIVGGKTKKNRRKNKKSHRRYKK